jgi:hypothetical protein
MRHGRHGWGHKWRPTAAKPIYMALGIAVGLFLHIFGLGLWLGKLSAAGLAQCFFCLALGARGGFPVEVAHFFANNGAFGGGNCRRARAVCVQRWHWVVHSAVGLARFCLRRDRANFFVRRCPSMTGLRS